MFFSGDSALYNELSVNATNKERKVLKYFLKQGCCSFGGLRDEDYLRYVRKRVENETSEEKALSKLNIIRDQVNEIEPVHFGGWKYGGALVKRRSNGEYISTSYQDSWLFFSDQQIFLYQYTFSTIDDRKFHSTNEYFYRDITSFSTVVKTERTRGDDSIDTMMFQLVVPGDHLAIAYTNVDERDDIYDVMSIRMHHLLSYLS